MTPWGLTLSCTCASEQIPGTSAHREGEAPPEHSNTEPPETEPASVCQAKESHQETSRSRGLETGHAQSGQPEGLGTWPRDTGTPGAFMHAMAPSRRAEQGCPVVRAERRQGGATTRAETRGAPLQRNGLAAHRLGHRELPVRDTVTRDLKKPTSPRNHMAHMPGAHNSRAAWTSGSS